MSESLKAFERKMQERFALLHRKDELETGIRASHRAATSLMLETLEEISAIADKHGYEMLVERSGRGSWNTGGLVRFDSSERSELIPMAVSAGVDPPSMRFCLMNGKRAVDCRIGFDIGSQRAYVGVSYAYADERGVHTQLFRGFEDLYEARDMDLFLAKRDTFTGKRLNQDNLERHLGILLDEYNKISDAFLAAQVERKPVRNL